MELRMEDMEIFQPRSGKSLVRFQIYAPFVKHSLVPMRPLLPNLQYFQLVGATDPIQLSSIIDALISPNLLEIRTPGRAWGSLHPVSSSYLVSRIVESCPRIRRLELFTQTPPLLPRVNELGQESLPKVQLFSSLNRAATQLCNLRSFGAGPEILTRDTLASLGTLPSLELLTISFPGRVPLRILPSHFPPLPNGFTSLRHLGMFSFTTALAARLWRILPFVHQITSVCIQVASDTHPGDEAYLLSSICQFSPNVTDLHLNFGKEDLTEAMDVFTPDVIGQLAPLPLQRVRIETYSSELVRPTNIDQLAQAFGNVEYLELGDCYFRLQDLASISNYMPKLRFLMSRFDLPSPPSATPQSFLEFCSTVSSSISPSSSTLYLESPFMADHRIDDIVQPSDDFVRSLASVFHCMWPNGVHCVLEERTRYGDYAELGSKAVKLLNETLKQLCYPKTIDIQERDRRLASEWKYNNSNSAPWINLY